MLSYLKDQNTVPASDDMSDSNEAATNAEDYLTVSGHNQKLRRSTMILAVVSAVAVLGVWMMVKKTNPATVNAQPSENQVQLETALAQLNSMQAEMNSQMNSVPGRFYQFDNVDQVGVNELKKNPFDIRDTSAALKSDTAGAQQHEQILQEAQVIQMGMELWSITETPNGMCCMIDDKVLYLGDSYKNMTVKAISEKSVTLAYKGLDVELKMD